MERHNLASLVAFAAAALVLVIAVPADAAAPEEAYIAARDAAIAKIKAASDAEPENPTAGDDDKVLALDQAARAALERQMRAIIGPIAIEGMYGQGALNLDTLIEGDEDFGLLDGLVYGGVDAKTRIIVTTDGLFRRWLAGHKDWWGKNSPSLPQEPDAAVRDNDFYTQAVLTDSAIVQFADLPIEKPPASLFAYAMLASRTQDQIPSKADEIFVALAQGGHVFIASSKDIRAVGPIPACEAIRKKAADSAEQSGAGDDRPDLPSGPDAAFLRCFGDKASRQSGFAAAAQAAQSLIGRLPLH